MDEIYGGEIYRNHHEALVAAWSDWMSAQGLNSAETALRFAEEGLQNNIAGAELEGWQWPKDGGDEPTDVQHYEAYKDVLIKLRRVYLFDCIQAHQEACKLWLSTGGRCTRADKRRRVNESAVDLIVCFLRVYDSPWVIRLRGLGSEAEELSQKDFRSEVTSILIPCKPSDKVFSLVSQYQQSYKDRSALQISLWEECKKEGAEALFRA